MRMHVLLMYILTAFMNAHTFELMVINKISIGTYAVHNKQQ